MLFITGYVYHNSTGFIERHWFNVFIYVVSISYINHCNVGDELLVWYYLLIMYFNKCSCRTKSPKFTCAAEKKVLQRDRGISQLGIPSFRLLYFRFFSIQKFNNTVKKYHKSCLDNVLKPRNRLNRGGTGTFVCCA